MEGIIQVAFFVMLLAVGYVIGTVAEKRHYKSIEARERESIHVPVMTLKDVAFGERRVVRSELVSGSVVISVDYFKRFLAGIRNIFGGRVKSYESLIDRGRREAMLRMKEAAGGATAIVNVRVETATIGRNAHKKGVGSVEVLAYGTAITLEE